jgi:hypothetical protein
MDNFGELTSNTVSMSTQLLSEVYLALRKRTDNLTFGNLTLTINHSFSIYITMNQNTFVQLPKEIREVYRCCSYAVPQFDIVVRQLLRIYGFSKDGELVTLIVKFSEFCKSQIPSRRLGLPLYELKEVIKEASELLPASSNEREAFLVALYNFIIPPLQGSEKQACQSLIVNIFGPFVQPHDTEEIHKLLTDYFKFRDLHFTPALERNIIDCFEGISRWSSLHQMDSSLAGVDLVIDCVKFIMSKVSQKHVLSKTIFPKVYTTGELYGEFVPKAAGEGMDFRPGVIQLLIKEILTQYPSAIDDDLGRMTTIHNEKQIERWIVFDGTASNSWMEALSTGIDLSNRFIVLPNFEKLKLPPNLKMFFKSETLANLAPSTIVRLGKIKPGHEYSWKQHLQVTLEKLENDYPILTDRQLPFRVQGWMTKFLEFLFDGKGLASVDWIIRPTDLELTNNFLTVFKALLNDFMTGNFDRDEHQAKLESIVSSMMFVSVGISIGSLVSTIHRERFENLVEDKLAHLMATENKHVLNKCLSSKTFQAEDYEKEFEPLIIDLNSLDELKLAPKLRLLTPEQVWYSKLLAKLTVSKKNLLLLGDGRSSISRLIPQILSSAVEINSNLQTVLTKWTPDFKPSDLLTQIKKSLSSRNKLHYVAKTAGGVVISAEDINMPPKDIAGDIGAMELLRCILKEGQVFDTVLGDPVKFEGLHVMLTANLAISPSDFLTRRYRRKMAVIGLQGDPKTDYQMTIYHACHNLCPPMLPDYFDKDMISEVGNRMADVFQAATLEFSKLFKGVVTKDMIHLDKMVDLISMACSIKVPFEREEQLFSHILSELLLYMRLVCSEVTETQVRNALVGVLSKVYRSFDINTLQMNKNQVNVLNQASGVFRLSFEEGAKDSFKKVVSELVTSNKEFRDFPLLEEPLDALYGCQRLLSMSGSRLLLKTSNDPKQLLGLAARLLRFELYELDLASGDQLATLAKQLGQILEEALSKKKWRIVMLRLGSIRNLAVLRLIQDTLVLGDSSQLVLGKSAVRDAIYSADLESVDENQFVQSVWNHRCRFVFIIDTFNSEIQSQLGNYNVINTSLGPLKVAEWQTSSLVSVALAIMEKYEELDMTPEERQLTAKCLAEVYLFTKKELASHNVEIRQTSFNHSCQYACEIRAKAKSEIKDQLGNLQTAITRFKAMNRLKEELIAIETQARLKQKEAEKLLEEIINFLKEQQQEVLQKKE